MMFGYNYTISAYVRWKLIRVPTLRQSSSDLSSHWDLQLSVLMDKIRSRGTTKSRQTRLLGISAAPVMLMAVVSAILLQGISADNVQLSSLTNSFYRLFDTAKTTLECHVCKVRYSITANGFRISSSTGRICWAFVVGANSWLWDVVGQPESHHSITVCVAERGTSSLEITLLHVRNSCYILKPIYFVVWNFGSISVDKPGVDWKPFSEFEKVSRTLNDESWANVCLVVSLFHGTAVSFFPDIRASI